MAIQTTGLDGRCNVEHTRAQGSSAKLPQDTRAKQHARCLFHARAVEASCQHVVSLDVSERPAARYEAISKETRSTSLFVAPVAAYFTLLDQRSRSLDGARVYLLINGQIIDAPETTPYKFGPIVARTFSVALKHMSRAQVVAVDQFAEKYRMSVESTYLPFDYPKYSSADFRAASMRPLFEYGARCAESGRLWTTMDETMATVAAAAQASRQTPPAVRKVECPLRDVQFTAVDER